MTAIMANPLLADFVKKDSRGKGAGIEQAGGSAGNIVSNSMFEAAGSGSGALYWTGGFTLMMGGLSVPCLKEKKRIFTYIKEKSGKLIKVKPAPTKEGEDAPLKSSKTMVKDFNSKGVKGEKGKTRAQVALLSGQLQTVASGNPRFLLTFYGQLVSRLLENVFQSYFLLWLYSFTKGDDPVIEKSEANSIY